MAAVCEHTGTIDGLGAIRELGEIDGLPVFWRSAPSEGTPVLYLHGVPNNADQWTPFLQRSGGVAVDLPGFGRSGKPGHLDYSIEGYDRFIEHFLDLLEIERVSLVMHDWGAVGLAFAQRLPTRVARLVIVNAVPLLPGYRWHRIARLWRTPVLGELSMGITSARVLRLISREANVSDGPLPEPFLASVVEHFDPGTQRAILRLYRNSPPERLAAAGADLATLGCPALVLWGERDPYIAPRFATAYAERIPTAELELAAAAGHWPWLDRPELVARIVDFATAP